MPELVQHSLRGRITVENKPHPLTPGVARLGVLARMQQPRGMMDSIAAGAPPGDDWILVGNHAQMEDYVAVKILERYLLLRQGRDPDAESPKGPFEPKTTPNVGN